MFLYFIVGYVLVVNRTLLEARVEAFSGDLELDLVPRVSINFFVMWLPGDRNVTYTRIRLIFGLIQTIFGSYNHSN